MRPPLPPRVAEWLLSLLVGPGSARDVVLGDLHEEFARFASRRRRLGHGLAILWYWREAARIGARLAWRRLARHVARPASLPGPLPYRGDSIMRTLLLDLRYAWRSLVKRPATSAIIVATLALGLGTNAAIFGLIDALVLRPFPLPDLDRIAFILQTRPGDGIGTQETVAPANFVDWKKQADVFDRLAAVESWDVNLAGVDEPERVPGVFVSADFFAVLGVQPALGRGFQDDEEVHGRHRRAVLSHTLWQRRFGSDPRILGKPVLLDTEAYEIVGVAPRGFDFPQGSQIWAPLAMTPEVAANRRTRYLTVLGRLAPGRTLEDAQVQMAVIAQRLEEQYPEANRDRGARVTTLIEGMKDPGLGPILLLWQASAAFVLLIACANIANLLLARGAERQRDLAVRLALGAGRARLVGQLLMESATLAVLSIPLALAVAAGALHVIRVAMPPRIIRFVSGWETMSVDTRSFAFTLLLALAAAAVFGIVPAWQASRQRVVDALKDGGRGSTSGRQRLRRGLVVSEVALSLPLLVAAALSLSSVNRFLYGPQGYDPNGVLVARAVLPDARYAEPDSRRQFTDRVLSRAAALPGVDAAAIVNVVPAGSNNSGRAMEIEGRPNPDPLNPPTVDYRAATPAFFDALRIPIGRGRSFTDADRVDGLPVAIVTESLAAHYWPGADPLGRRLRLGDGPWLTVVGVAGDVVHDWFGRRRYPTVYQPYAQAPTGSIVLVVRTAGEPASLGLPLTAAVRAIDPSQPLFDVMPMQRLLHERTIGLQYVAAIMGAFGLLALILAVVGVYSVMAYLVVQRTHEIGVRMALGADRRQVFRLTVGQTGRLAVLGVAIGLVLSVLAARFLEANLAGAISNDLRLQAGLAAVLIVSALLAGYIPARRASSIDPIVALRAE